MNLESKAFSHYWNKYSSEKELEFNSLRKRYINETDIKYGSRGKIITHGATGDLINKHYRDVMEIIDDMKGQNLCKGFEKSYSTILAKIESIDSKNVNSYFFIVGKRELPAAIPAEVLNNKNPVKLSLYHGLFCFFLTCDAL